MGRCLGRVGSFLAGIRRHTHAGEFRWEGVNSWWPEGGIVAEPAASVAPCVSMVHFLLPTYFSSSYSRRRSAFADTYPKQMIVVQISVSQLVRRWGQHGGPNRSTRIPNKACRWGGGRQEGTLQACPDPWTAFLPEWRAPLSAIDHMDSLFRCPRDRLRVQGGGFCPDTWSFGSDIAIAWGL